MSTDPTRNVVAFHYRRGGDDLVAVAEAPTRDEDCIQQAWRIVRTQGIDASEVSEMMTEWSPSTRDGHFIGSTFPGIDVRYNFERPTDPALWEAAFAAARAEIDRGLAAFQPDQHLTDPAAPPGNAATSDGPGQLLPVLCGPSSGRARALMEMNMLVQRPLVPEKVFVALAMVSMTPRGTLGMQWVTPHHYQQLGEPPFGELLELAAGNLSQGLRVSGHRTPNGDILTLERPGYLAGSAVALPNFYQHMSEVLQAERLIVGVPCPDDLVVADADSANAEGVRQMTMETAYRDGFLGPTVLLMDRTGTRVLADREI
jgi:hypothetical protein